MTRCGPLEASVCHVCEQGNRGGEATDLPHGGGGPGLHAVTSPMRLPNTPFCVDSFHGGDTSYHPIFFLTHAHADHLAGLGPQWAAGRLYCTAITKALIVRKCGVDAALMVRPSLAPRGPCSGDAGLLGRADRSPPGCPPNGVP